MSVATNLSTRCFGQTDTDMESSASASARGRSALGGRSAGAAREDADSIAAIRHAVSVSINWIDTAAVYGLGYSEEVVREALAPLHEVGAAPYVFTKCGLVWNPNDHETRPARTANPESLKRE